MHSRNTILLAVFITLAVQTIVVFAFQNPVLDGQMNGADSYMRLHRVLNLYEHGNWYDAFDFRTNAPYGDLIHWTRLLDSILFAGAWIGSAVTDFPRALFAWGVLIGPVLLLALVPIWSWGPGGFLVMDEDGKRTESADIRIVTQRAPNEAESRDLIFAQRVCKHVKSNAIVLAKDGMIVGVGAGQMSRVDAARLAVNKAGDRAQGAVFASDAFLPFNDALEVALDAGATAAIQPGGSKNDDKCVKFADERGITMAFTGTRHFLH